MRPLLQHQVDAERFLERRGGSGAIFMEPGLGKTRVAIRRALRAPMIVFAPINPTIFGWPEQLREWAGDLSWAVVRGDPRERERVLFDQVPDVAVINYELTHWFYDVVARRRRMPYPILCLDESSAVKNADSIAHRALWNVAHAFDEVIPMNGTPAENSLHDTWGQLRFVGAGSREGLGERVGVFRERYFKAVPRENYVAWKLVRGEELRQAAAPYCFVRRADDCLDMPDLVHVDVRFDLSGQQRKYYDRMKRTHTIPLDEPVLLPNAGVELDKLRQVCSGFVYSEDRRGLRVVTSVGRGKIDACIECLEESRGRPVLVGFWYQGSKALIQDRCRKNLGIRVPAIDRFTPIEERRRLFRMWSNGELPVLAGQIASVAKGMNMQSPQASILMYDLPWSHGLYWQFVRRVWRQGQRTRVVVRRLIARGTAETYVAWVLKQKQAAEEELMRVILEEELI